MRSKGAKDLTLDGTPVFGTKRRSIIEEDEAGKAG